MCTISWRHLLYLFVEVYGDHPDLHVLTHSLPTRRSSALGRSPPASPVCAPARHTRVCRPKSRMGSGWCCRYRRSWLDVADALEFRVARFQRGDVGVVGGHDGLDRAGLGARHRAGSGQLVGHRTEARRVGTEWVSTWRSRVSPVHYKKKIDNKNI